MINKAFKKTIIFVIITIFICGNILPNISGETEILNNNTITEMVKYSKVSPRMVYGYLYVNDVLAPNGVTVSLTFSNQTVTNNTFSNGNYVLNFNEEDNEVGNFSVLFFGVWYTPIDNQTLVIKSGVVVYEINLHIITPSLDKIYVDDDFNESTPGWNFTHFNRVQDGINAVNEDGVVFVFNGLYNEDLLVNKTIKLSGEGRTNTIIKGDQNYITVNVVADSVNLSNFTIENIWADGNIGICLNSDHNIIWNNYLYGNGDDGITVFGDSNTISNNVFEDNADGIGIGDYYIDNLVYRNIISYCTDDGVYGGNNSYFVGNNIHNNSDCGIYLKSYSNNTIILNDISDNGYGIYISSPSKNNILYHNNFIDNTQNSYDSGDNFWDNGYPSGGNYWDDYTGNDSNGDGIGDTPYAIPGGVNSDEYPFIYPDFWEFDPPIANFNYSPSNPDVMDLIQFNDTSSAGSSIEDWWWDFDDGYYSTVQNPIHLYIAPGLYNVSLTLTDVYGRMDMIQKSVMVSVSNEPPNTPSIYGPNNVSVGIEYEYTFNAMDPEGNDVFYLIDWGDNTSSDWIGSFSSGENVTRKHKFTQQSLFFIRIKAKDIYGDESDWGTLKVVVPKDKHINLSPFLQRFVELFPNVFSVLKYIFGLL